jgi:hypothetical protein
MTEPTLLRSRLRSRDGGVSVVRSETAVDIHREHRTCVLAQCLQRLERLDEPAWDTSSGSLLSGRDAIHAAWRHA